VWGAAGCSVPRGRARAWTRGGKSWVIGGVHPSSDERRPSGTGDGGAEGLPGTERLGDGARGGVGRLDPLRRFVAVLSTWVLLGLAQPGLLRPDGFGHLAFFALGPWAYAASRPTGWPEGGGRGGWRGGPGRRAAVRAFVAEWLAHSLGLLWWFLWMRHLLPWLLVPMALVPSLYMAAGGVLLRHLARRFPLALAAPVAWAVAELVRWSLPPPFSFGWLRTGELMHDTLWLSGSARVWGSEGLTVVLAALGGLAADVFLALRRAGGTPRPQAGASDGRDPARVAPLAWVAGLGPLVLGVALARFVPAPSTAGDARVLVAQPGIEQALKGGKGDYVVDELTPLVEEVRAGLAAAGERAPEVVLMGESILWGWHAPDDVLAAFEAGARPPAWSAWATMDRRELAGWAEVQRAVVDVFYGVPRGAAGRGRLAKVRELLHGVDAAWAEDARAGRRLLPGGTWLCAGIEAWIVVPGSDGAGSEGSPPELRRRNSVGLWDSSGDLVDIGAKVQLVPAAEDISPVVHVPFVVSTLRRVGGYVPDFVPAETTHVLELRRTGGPPLRLGATVCYDNAFDRPYVEPLQRGPVDFFVVASNEAWYRTSPEMDHLFAMARMRAIATGRAMVRATNSGISAVIGPDGRDVAVLEVAGQRKMVRGFLLADVPMPVDAAARTPFVRTRGLQQVLGLVLALVLVLAAGRGPRRSGYPGGGQR
jgi:apolipoprotein N-acyltransferase